MKRWQHERLQINSMDDSTLGRLNDNRILPLSRFLWGGKSSSTLLITDHPTASSVSWVKATFSQHISLHLYYKCIHKYYSNSYHQRMFNILMQQTYYDMLNSYVASGRNWLRRLRYAASCPEWSVIVCSS